MKNTKKPRKGSKPFGAISTTEGSVIRMLNRKNVNNKKSEDEKNLIGEVLEKLRDAGPEIKNDQIKKVLKTQRDENYPDVPTDRIGPILSLICDTYRNAKPIPMTLLQSACRLADMGLRIFPVHTMIYGFCSCGNKKCENAAKHPRIKAWPAEASKDKNQITRWWRRWPKSNIGILCGVETGIVVLDVDPRNGGSVSLEDLQCDHEDLPETYLTNTGGGGLHFYFKVPKGIKNLQKKTNFRPGLDFQGDASFVIGIGSLHLSGERYTKHPQSLDTPVDLPHWLINETQKTEKLEEKTVPVRLGPGKRNAGLTSMAGGMRNKGFEQEEIEATLLNVNKRMCKPPLSDDEVINIVRSVSRYKTGPERKEKKKKRESVSVQMIKIVLENDKIELFRDEKKVPYAMFTFKNRREIWPIDSSQFRDWMAKTFFEVKGFAINRAAEEDAKAVFRGTVLRDAKTFKLSNRVCWDDDGNLWYDLGDERWRAVKITGKGWEIVDKPPILFRRETHQTPQVEPVSGGDVAQILRFFNLKEDPENRCLFLNYLISNFIPGFPHPILFLYGDKGSGKSTTTTIIKKLVDPSVSEFFRPSRDEKQLVQQLAHHWFIAYDNLSRLPDWMSDAFCCASTGYGFSKRKLQTDDEDFIYFFKCCLAINDIGIAAKKPDLLDRAVLIELKYIDIKDRLGEKEFWKKFEAEKPKILGAIFTNLSKAIKHEKKIKIDGLPRMADFALWGEAISLGNQLYPKNFFLESYDKNRALQDREIVENDPVANAIFHLMKDCDTWLGTAQELLNALNSMLDERGIERKSDKAWPKSARSCGRKMAIVKASLRGLGIIITDQRKSVRREYTIKKVTLA